MKIIRYLDHSGRSCHAAKQLDGSALRIEGDIYGDHRVTNEPINALRQLSPIIPTQILCIGPNYDSMPSRPAPRSRSARFFL